VNANYNTIRKQRQLLGTKHTERKTKLFERTKVMTTCKWLKTPREINITKLEYKVVKTGKKYN